MALVWQPDGFTGPIMEVGEMKLRYLIVDGNNQLKLIRRAQVEAIWSGHVPASQYGCGDLTELRLISVVCDGRIFATSRIYLLRIALTDGYFTRRNCRILRSFAMPSRVTAQEMFEHHTEGWPTDFFTQLAVALDVPRTLLDVPFGIGGPLLIAAALRISPKSAARYLEMNGQSLLLARHSSSARSGSESINRQCLVRQCRREPGVPINPAQASRR